MEVQSLVDSSVKTQDLEDSRRELIALSGVPAPYLGYGDVVELQSQLVHVNLSNGKFLITYNYEDIMLLIL